MKIITNENYVDKAEQVIKHLQGLKDQRGYSIPLVTTSKIRNLLSMTADIYNDVMLLQDEELTERIKEQLSYLRIRCLYEAGRENSVKLFVKQSEVLDILPEIGNRKDYILFSHYMEALVAWRKYLDSRDA